MNAISQEQAVDFFIAYLAKHSEELSLPLLTERSSFRLVKLQRKWGDQMSLQVKIPLEDDVDLLTTTSLPDPMEIAELDRQAEELADRLAGFERDKDELIEKLIDFRSHAQKAFRKLPAKSPLKFVSVDLVLDDTQAEACCMLRYEMLGDDTSPSVGTAEISEREEIASELASRRDEQEVLASRAREIKREGADGAVDAVLVAFVEGLGLEPVEVIRTAQNPARTVPFDPIGPDTVLFWKEGMLTLGTQLDDNIRYHGGFLFVQKCPDQLIGDIAGRRVSDLITHAALPDDLVFVSGTAVPGKRCNFEVVMQYSLFQHEGGITW